MLIKLTNVNDSNKIVLVNMFNVLSIHQRDTTSHGLVSEIRFNVREGEHRNVTMEVKESHDEIIDAVNRSKSASPSSNIQP